MMKGRLIIAIITTILEEAAIFVVGVWGLPKIGVKLPLWGILLIMIGWVTYGTITYRAGTQALMIGHTIGLSNMVGVKGKVASPLNPEGMVKVNGELWKARSESGNLETGEQITVVGQDRLKLIVKK
jgi:membrane protein implicated in regulation of membrane protease activity